MHNACGYTFRSLSLVPLLVISSATTGQAQSHADHNLGTVDFPVSCSAEARVEFNRAVALLHHMTYPQARESFEHVATVDPECAMAHWGIATTLFQPLWPTRPSPRRSSADGMKCRRRSNWHRRRNANGCSSPPLKPSSSIPHRPTTGCGSAAGSRRWRRCTLRSLTTRSRDVLRAGAPGHDAIGHHIEGHMPIERPKSC